jgi:hypothetical protein
VFHNQGSLQKTNDSTNYFFILRNIVKLIEPDGTFLALVSKKCFSKIQRLDGCKQSKSKTKNKLNEKFKMRNADLS